jgi:lipopolysaccharide assembly outer membrane protein LptD (OstA)
MGGKVTAGNMEIADDMTIYRAGMTQRWQTKRGPVGNRHIIDWVTFSTHFNYYPEANQNNGKDIGLVDYNFLWHVGDRFSLFSSGLYDYHDKGQKITRLGGIWQRPERGNVSVMFDQLDGLIAREYLTLSLGYTMNEKYSFDYTTSYDIKDKWINVGHNFFFTRTGEAFRFMLGATYSEAKNEWSFSFGLEPVFMRGLAKKAMAKVSQAQAMQ